MCLKCVTPQHTRYITLSTGGRRLNIICDVDSKVERVKAAFEKADKDSSLGRIDDTKRDKER